MTEPAVLGLEDGTVLYGLSVGAPGETIGEVVFNTAMSGYQEILTDPSYARQIVTLTYPHIGNTGTNPEDCESDRVHAAGLVIRNLPPRASSYRATETLPQFLRREGVVSIADVDTRRLTRLIREKGALAGCILAGSRDGAAAVEKARGFPGLKGMDLARVVTTAASYDWSEGAWRHAQDGRATDIHVVHRVVAWDYGIKRNILRLLVDAGCQVTVVPAMTPADEVLAMQPHGVLLSNGPGDPEPCDYAIAATQACMAAGVPVFGICLGHQILGLAGGARTVKMKFGHHGANHPVQDLDTGQVLITSQNHGFAVDEATLPDNLRATHRSLFDGSLQGIERTDCPAFSFQGHPEASPGPHDLRPLFKRFTAMMAGARPE